MSCADIDGRKIAPGDADSYGELAEYPGKYITASPAVWDGKKRADITYQVLVYSFADTPDDSDDIGDLKGLRERLDYLDGLGVSGVWLSPVHPCVSYHGYGVSDYFGVRKEFGTEQDLKDFIDAAHEKGIRVYLDYVLNHCGSDNPWFEDAKSDAGSRYRDWFVFSENPENDIAEGKIAQISSQGAAGYAADEWRPLPGNSGYEGVLKFRLDLSDNSNPTVTVTEASESEIDTDNTVAGTDDKYIHYDSKAGRRRMYNRGGGIYELTFAFKSGWGFLITSSETGWQDKYGAESRAVSIRFGVPFPLVARTSSVEPADITFRTPMMWYSVFRTDKYADFNFGPSDRAEESPAFQELLRSAEHWIRLGIDGLRLDAVKHIYRNDTSNENPVFLGKWYEATNRLYKDFGNGCQSEFYTVGEMLTSRVENVAPYYKGLPALFEFAFWTRLREGINSGEGYQFVDNILGYREQYRSYRENFIEPTKLSNHDENRTGSGLGKSKEKMRLAAAVLLTAGGDPYIYQGEELGYWGVLDNGDEYVRTPILWDRERRSLAKGLLGNKIDNSMLTSGISVEAQSENPESLLNVYRCFCRLRNTYQSLAKGEMERHPVFNSSGSFRNICAYYRTYDNERMLVVHNFSSKPSCIKLDDSLENAVGLAGSAKVAGSGGKSILTLGPYSTVVFHL